MPGFMKTVLKTYGHVFGVSVRYELLTKCEVKMAGYWPSFFFARLWTEMESSSINSQKRTRPISRHLDRTSLVNKAFIIWLSEKFSCGTCG